MELVWGPITICHNMESFKMFLHVFVYTGVTVKLPLDAYNYMTMTVTFPGLRFDDTVEKLF